MALFNYIPKSSPLKRWITHRNVYIISLATILCGLGWSNVMMSIGQLFLVGNWIAELDFKQKLRRAVGQPLIVLMLLFYLLHLVGFAWSQELNYALKDATNKLPLLVLPLIIGTSPALKKQEWRLLFTAYISTILLLTIVSFLKYLGWTNEVITNKRDLSINISHIRYGLNICLTIVLLLFQPLSNKLDSPYVRIPIILWFSLCLLLFQFYTALFILMLLGVFVFINGIYQKTPFKSISMITSASFSIIMLIVGILVAKVYKEYKTPVTLEYDQESFFPARSAGGEVYKWQGDLYSKENGVYLNRYVAWNELERGWNSRSELNFWGKDHKGQPLAKTLLRFMSSKGLKKDSVGINKLHQEEISAIENGIANSYYINHSPIENRIHQTFYELDKFEESGSANSFSFALRLVYWEVAINLIKENFVFGVGTGDVENAFKAYYEMNDVDLQEKYRRRSHNQFLSIGVAFGIFGLLFFLLYLILPLLLTFRKQPLFVTFWLIACLSFLTEDTLETQAGVTFFALFWSIFSFAVQPLYFKSL